MKRVIVALVLLLVAGCVDEAGLRREAATRDCVHVANAFAVRCPGGNPRQEAQSLECEYADAIRDRDALLDECIPALVALPCGSEGPLPDSCADQIILWGY